MLPQSTPTSSHAISRLEHLALAAGGAIFAFHGAGLLAGAISLLIGLTVGPIPFLAGVIAMPASAWLLLAHRRRQRAELVGASGIAVLTLAACIFVAGRFYDTTYDGQWYHGETVLQLAEGWNPTRGDLTPQQVPLESTRWRATHFPHGPCIVAAGIYNITKRFETAKAGNALLLGGSFWLALAALLSLPRCAGDAPPPSGGIAHRQTAAAVALAAAAALNPVAISQSMSLYVDGQIASLLLGLVSLSVLLAAREGQPRWPLLVLAALMLMSLVNAKFTGVILGSAWVAGTALMLALLGRGEVARRLAAAGALAVAAGVLVVGYAPYVTNTLGHGHPFHPLAGPNRLPHDWDLDRPVDLNARGRVGRLVYSLLSVPHNGRANDRFMPTRPGWPLVVAFRQGAWGAFIYPDTRCGGFGPLFSAALVLALGILATLTVGHRRAALLASAAIAMLFASALVNPEAWWARYSPHLYLAPVVAAAAAWTVRRRAPRTLAWLVALLLLGNGVGIGIVYAQSQIEGTRQVRDEYAALRAAFGPLLVDFRESPANRARLREAGIEFIEAPLDDSHPRLVGSQARWRLPGL